MFNDFFYWLRSHTFTRYHIIDIRGQDGYKWGWIDRSHAMYLACFKILVDFVEKEDPQVGLRSIDEWRGGIDDAEWEFSREAVEIQVATEKEIRAIYDWWKTGRKQEAEACTALLKDVDTSFEAMFKPIPGTELSEFVPMRGEGYSKWHTEYNRLEAKDEEMLQRLMKVRGSLWT